MVGRAPREQRPHRFLQRGIADGGQPGGFAARQPEHLARLHQLPEDGDGRGGVQETCGRNLRECQGPGRGAERRPHERGRVAGRQQPEAGQRTLAPTVARRCGVEHDSARDRRLRRGGADDHTVAARRRDELAQAHLGQAGRAGRQRFGFQESDACVDAGRAGQHLHERPVGDTGPVREHPQLDVEPVALGKRSGCREDRAAGDRSALDAHQGSGHPPPGLRARDRLVMHLDRAHTHLLAARHQREPVARGDRPRPQRARDHRADPAQREGTVDRHPRRSLRRPGLDRRGRPIERGTQVVEAGP